MSYWKSKVLPKLKKIFPEGKKKGAALACKTFDSSKESYEKEIGEKTSDLQVKVVEIYKSSTSIVVKKLLKEPSEDGVKGSPKEVQDVLGELAKAGFPGAQVVSEYGTKYGPTLVPGPIVYIFSKTSTFLVDEPLPVEPEPEPTPREAPAEGEPSEEKKEETPCEEKKEESTEEKKEEEVVAVVEEKKEEVEAVVEEKKEEVVAVVEEKKEEVLEEKKEEVVEKKEEATPPPAEKPAC